MIHELLLALSGYPSPLLSASNKKAPKSIFYDLLSPAEHALLISLSRDLGQKHSSIRAKANDVVASHPSTVCRAVCALVLSKHLAQFQQKILDVEKDILDEDPKIVGAYNIVPLSSIVRAFNGWERKFDWLWRLVSSIQTKESREEQKGSTAQELCTASDIIAHLRDATHTGYPDIEELSLDLVKAAETAWLKQLTSWVLYGKLPTIGAADFFIFQVTQGSDDGEANDGYSIRSDLVPPFVVPETTRSVLFIGRSLNYLRRRGISGGASNDLGHGPSISELQTRHLTELSSLTFPISPSRFTAAIRSIRLSLSKNALQKLLPLFKILEVLRILKDFFLLERGEFALALISAADERLAEKQSSSMDNHRPKGLDSLRHIMIKEGEVNSILPRAWSTMTSLQSLDDEDGDEDLELARELMELSLESKTRREKRSTDQEISFGLTEDFQDFLLPTATALTLRIQPPLDLFLTPTEVTTYSRMHAYLLAIRRAHLHLSKLMTLSALRKDPLLSPSSSASERLEALNLQRYRTRARFIKMRPIWATVGSATFFLAEFGTYIQSEVIQDSWQEFREWLGPRTATSSRPQFREEADLNASLGTSTSSLQILPDRGPSISEAANQPEEPLRDPERLMMAHQRLLTALCRSSLLDNTSFTGRLRTFMIDVDHLCALIGRVIAVQQTVDLEKNLEPRGAATNNASEEARLFGDLASARGKLDTGLTAIVSLLRDADSARTATISTYGLKGLKDSGEFVPKRNNRLDRLLLKLDYASPQTRASHPSDADAFRWSE